MKVLKKIKENTINQKIGLVLFNLLQNLQNHHCFLILWKGICHSIIGSNIMIKENVIIIAFPIPWKRIRHFIIGSNIMIKENGIYTPLPV